MKPRVCVNCPKMLYTRDTAISHIQNKHMLHCRDCGAPFRNQDLLTSHACQPKPVPNNHKVCRVCEKLFTSRKVMQRHMLIHSGEKPFSCCDQSFYDLQGLRQHQQKHKERSYVCEKCGYATSDAHYLRVHERVHTGERPFRCDQCDKSYLHKSGLTDHIRVHTGLRPYKCSRCYDTFSSAASRHYHEASHTKPFRCTVCDYRSVTKTKLTIHMRIHSNERPFKCTTCDFDTTQKHTLLKHMKKHTGPFCINPDCIVTRRRIPVKNEGELCGFCSNSYKRGDKEFAVFEALASHDWRLATFVRDKALGCNVRRRPDGYIDLHVLAGRVLFVVEIDEFQHRAQSVECELGRLQEIQERHGGAIYVVRYNPDQKDGLEESTLNRLAERCVEILDTDHEEALEAFGGFIVEYIGYTEARVGRLDKAWFDSQA